MHNTTNHKTAIPKIRKSKIEKSLLWKFDFSECRTCDQNDRTPNQKLSDVKNVPNGLATIRGIESLRMVDDVKKGRQNILWSWCGR